ncbi:hypothetical protein C8J56DRAFT_346538 [Mycena floridula]|nr:hypothetical protein C8J56DRAFT_346538 [Mycena floridula]
MDEKDTKRDRAVSLLLLFCGDFSFYFLSNPRLLSAVCFHSFTTYLWLWSFVLSFAPSLPLSISSLFCSSSLGPSVVIFLRACDPSLSRRALRAVHCRPISILAISISWTFCRLFGFSLFPLFCPVILSLVYHH